MDICIYNIYISHWYTNADESDAVATNADDDSDSSEDDNTSSEDDNTTSTDDKNAVPVAPVINYRVGDNVLALDGRGWYLAHVSRIRPDTMTVYFPCEGKTKNLMPANVREYKGLPQPRRADLLGKTFRFEGDDDIPAGTVWKVRRVLQPLGPELVKIDYINQF